MHGFYSPRLLLPFVLAASAAVPASAAPPQAGGAKTVPGNEITQFKGKLKAMRQGIVVVEKEDGTEALVAVPDQITSFQFIAKASPAFLRPGMLVRFSAEFGPGGIPTAPIAKLTLFQPVPPKSLHGRTKLQFTPGVHSDAKPGNNRQVPVMGKLTVVGSLVGVTPNGILTLRAGKMPVRVPVNQETQLEIHYNNLSLAQPGDPVSVAGFYQPPNENQVKADRITIRPERVFGEAPAKENRRRKGGDEKGKPEEGDAKKAAGEGKETDVPAKPDEGT